MAKITIKEADLYFSNREGAYFRWNKLKEEEKRSLLKKSKKLILNSDLYNIEKINDKELKEALFEQMLWYMLRPEAEKNMFPNNINPVVRKNLDKYKKQKIWEGIYQEIEHHKENESEIYTKSYSLISKEMHDPYKRLMIAVMEKLISDYIYEKRKRKNQNTGEIEDNPEFIQARNYIFEDNNYSDNYVFGFKFICRYINLDPKKMRKNIHERRLEKMAKYGIEFLRPTSIRDRNGKKEKEWIRQDEYKYELKKDAIKKANELQNLDGIKHRVVKLEKK